VCRALLCGQRMVREWRLRVRGGGAEWQAAAASSKRGRQWLRVSGVGARGRCASGGTRRGGGSLGRRRAGERGCESSCGGGEKAIDGTERGKESGGMRKRHI